MSAERRSRYLRVVRPGSGTGSDAAATPPLPVEPPLTPPLWLDAAGRRPATPTLPDAQRPPGTPGVPSGRAASDGAIPTQASRSTPSPSPRHEPCDEDPVGAALRASLLQAVDGVRPAPDSLAQLRRAVPQRRALKRRAYGGVAVAASLALLGLTALHSLGPSTATSAATGPMGSLLPGTHASTGRHGHGGPSTDVSTPGLPSMGDSAWPSRGRRPGGAVLVPLPSGGVTTVAASLAYVPAPTGALTECSRGQLGRGAAGLAAPDASGIVYGSFAVSNISGTSCKISSAGAIDVLAPVGTNVTRFTVTAHTIGDPAVSLPAPDPAHPALALAPGQTYVVDFAFVPGACPSNSGAGPTDTASAAAPATAGDVSAGATGSGSSSAGGTAGAAGAGTDGSAGGAGSTPPSSPGTPGGATGTGAGGTGSPSASPAPSVQLAAVPAAGGAAAASTTLQGACAGTIYRTDPLAAPH
ncbi:hypothetical protein ABH931_000095 [Streptacidiphilus sp. MAP12-33]|uniref:hypothetical protein n=1 Tax=Streptacidiphilus sp. MAP12-33 TaxID=3156266 RepID=UPI00351511C2